MSTATEQAPVAAGEKSAVEAKKPDAGAPAAPAAAAPAASAPAKPEAPKFRNVLDQPSSEADAGKEGTPDPAKPVEGDAKAKQEAPADLSSLKLPEGSILDPSLLEKTVALAKARGLSVEQAQAMLEASEEAALTYAERQQANHFRTVDGWVDQIKADPEMGGQQFVQTAKLAKSVVDRFGSQGLRDALNQTGLGNHPELVRMFAKIGKSMADDSLVKGSAQAPAKAPARPEDILFADTPVKSGGGDA